MKPFDTQFISLVFLGIFALVACVSLATAYRSLRYSYLKVGFYAILLEIGRQITNLFILAKPNDALLYYLSSILVFAASLLILQAYLLYSQRKTSVIRILIFIYLIVFIANLFTFNTNAAISWYFSYSPLILTHCLLIWAIWGANETTRNYATRNYGTLSLATLALLSRLTIPYLSASPTDLLGLIYLLDTLLICLLPGGLILLALTQVNKEHKQVIERGESAEATIKFILDNTEDIILTHTKRGIISTWNDRALEFFGYAGIEVIGRTKIEQLLSSTDSTENMARSTFVAQRTTGEMVTLVIRDLSRSSAEPPQGPVDRAIPIIQVPSNDDSNQLKILVIDDNKDVLKLVVRILTSAGHTVTSSLNSVDATQHLEGKDLLILDYNLPGENGLEAYARFLSLGSIAPAIFITGYNVTEVEEALKPEWHATVLKKPFMSEDILQSISSVQTLLRPS